MRNYSGAVRGGTRVKGVDTVGSAAMAHRDPETGQFVESDEMDGLSYSDHEHQQVTFIIENDDSANGEVEDVQKVEVNGPRGLDADELAELVYLRRQVSVIDNSGSTADDGTAEVEYGLEINTGNRDEFLPNLSGDGEENPVDEGGNTSLLYVDDDPGRLDYISTSMAFGGGKTSGPANLDRSVHYPGIYGSGPYLDPTDELGIFAEIDSNSVEQTGVFRLKVTLQMVWRIEEIPEGRSRYARP